MRDLCWAAAGMAAIVFMGCAAGAPHRDETETVEGSLEGQAGSPSVSAPPPASDDRAADVGDGTGDSPADAGLPATPPGEPCSQGTTEACLCAELGTEGERRCIFDTASPLDGFFSECEPCAEPEPVTDETSAPDAGPEPGLGDAPDAGDGATDSTTDSTSTPATPAAGMGCLSNPAMCMGPLQCCRPDGVCGVGVPGVCL